jgi:hypothetical protein
MDGAAIDYVGLRSPARVDSTRMAYVEEKNAVRHGRNEAVCPTTTLIVDAWSSNGIQEEASQLSRGFRSRSMQARGSQA